MPVWRDTWDGDPQVLVIAPGQVRGGLLRQAIVILRKPQHAAVVAVSDSLGGRLLATLPENLVGSEDYTVETCCALHAEPLPLRSM